MVLDEKVKIKQNHEEPQSLVSGIDLIRGD